MNLPLSRRRALRWLTALSGASLVGTREVLAAPFQGKTRAALLVGVGSYPVFKGNKEEEHPGALNDVAYLFQLTKLLEFPPAQIKLLQNADAKRAAIQAGLNALLTFCDSHPGAVVYFHFSGRGSVKVPPDTAAPLLPTLCPYDATLADAGKDVPLEYIAEWTRQVLRRKCYPVVTVDACWYSDLEGRDVELTNVYNPIPRLLTRQGTAGREVKTNFWTGSGVFFAAANATGLAYEYMVPPRFYGMMTHQFSRIVYEFLKKNRKPPTPTEVSEQLNGWLTPRRATYSSVRFYPEPGELMGASSSYTKALFDVESLSTLALEEAEKLGKEIVVKTDDRITPPIPGLTAERLRVGVNIRFPDGYKPSAKEKQTLANTIPLIRAALQEGMGMRGRLLDPFEAEADRFVRVVSPVAGGNWQVQIAGSEREVEARKVVAEADSLAGVNDFLRGEGGTYLKTQALAARLAFVATQKCSAKGVSLTVLKKASSGYVPVTEADTFQINDRLKLAATLPGAGYGILIDSYSTDRICQLVWPNADYIADLDPNNTATPAEREKNRAWWNIQGPKLHDNRLEAGKRDLPSNQLFFGVSENQPPGPARYRLLFVPREAIPTLHPLTPPTGSLWADNRAWEAALGVHLEELLSLLETRPEAFRLVEARYTVGVKEGEKP